ncbi:MAG TPA: archease [Nitrososphaeraceae archaeon]|nr:archease [Nitrososphaeraceae archaeon]
MDSEGYKYLEHSTDAFVQAHGSSLEVLFGNCAKGLVNIMFEIDKVEDRQFSTITASGEDLENLLFDWLEKVLLKILIDHIVVSRFSIEIFKKNANVEEKKYLLRARVGGEKVSYSKHNYKIEIKAITYHELKIKRVGPNYVATFLVDL